MAAVLPRRLGRDASPGLWITRSTNAKPVDKSLDKSAC
jgi:hypothetical protein